jgi:hypothetical protein
VDPPPVVSAGVEGMVNPPPVAAVGADFRRCRVPGAHAGRRWGTVTEAGTGVGRKSDGGSGEVAMELGSAVLARVCAEEEKPGNDKMGPQACGGWGGRDPPGESDHFPLTKLSTR